MIAVFIVTVCFLASTLMWALAKTASDADTFGEMTTDVLEINVIRKRNSLLLKR